MARASSGFISAALIRLLETPKIAQELRHNKQHIGVHILLLSPPLFFIAPLTLMSGLGMTDARMATWHIG